MGSAFFTYPGNSFGVAWEIYDGNFRQHHKDASFWSDEHPMGLLGLDHVTIAVENLESAVATLTKLTNATVLEKVTRPAAAAEGVRAQAGNIQFELLQPTGDGPVAAYLAQYGERIRSTVWKVADLGKVTSYLSSQGLDTQPGDADGALAIPAAQNKNLLFEFTE
jgi:4-hydroxyphenylpyruvate dioxygenase-like putative hemolysin